MLSFAEWVVLNFIQYVDESNWPYMVRSTLTRRMREMEDTGYIKDGRLTEKAFNAINEIENHRALVQGSEYYSVADLLQIVMQTKLSFVTDDIRAELLSGINFNFHTFFRRTVYDTSARYYPLESVLNSVPLNAISVINEIDDEIFDNLRFTKYDAKCGVRDVFLRAFFERNPDQSIFEVFPYLNEIKNDIGFTEEQDEKVVAEIRKSLDSIDKIADEINLLLDKTGYEQQMLVGLRNVVSSLGVETPDDLWDSKEIEYKIKCM